MTVLSMLCVLKRGGYVEPVVQIFIIHMLSGSMVVFSKSVKEYRELNGDE